MTKKILLNGNTALAHGAVAAGCRYYFGYPITPQNEIAETLASLLPPLGGTFIQAESELAAINMLLGAAAAGARAMTSSSGPGVSLMQEGLSYLAGAELPALVVNMTRVGPGLGGIAASQGDYKQSVWGGGHGDYYTIVLAPFSVQELYDLTLTAFQMAEKYRNPALILGDAILGQMKEPVLLKKFNRQNPERDYSIGGAAGRKPRLVKSLYLQDQEMEKHNRHLEAKYIKMKEDVLVELELPPGAELLLVAFGSCARVIKSALNQLKKEGCSVGWFRPITLFPFPEKELSEVTKKVHSVLVVEMNTGQMVKDVKLAVASGTKVDFMSFPGGALPLPSLVLAKIRSMLKGG